VVSFATYIQTPINGCRRTVPINPATSYTQVKICGLTSVQDAVAACESGVDALGLVFYPPSSRHITIESAAEIIRALPPFVMVTGLFLNEEKNVIDVSV